MNIWKVSRIDEVRYDEYDSFVCYARTSESARCMSPSESYRYNKELAQWEHFGFEWINGVRNRKEMWFATTYDAGWTIDFEKLNVEFLGISSEIEEKVILASFNAG